MYTITELKTISELGKGNKKISEIALALHLSTSQAYRVAQKLHQKRTATLSEGTLQPEIKTHLTMLQALLAKAVNLSRPLSSTGLQIYAALLEPRTIRELEQETGLHYTTILKKISQGRKLSLLLIKKRKYQINDKIWPDLKEFLAELRKYEDSIDPRIPPNSIIYFKNRQEIIFSNQESVDAEKTAFSAYERFGLKFLLITNYYYLPKKELSRKEVFLHSLRIAEKTKDQKDNLFIALFFAKFKNEMSRIYHPSVQDLRRIFRGENIPRYPSLEEIKERAKVYNLEV